MAETGFQIQTVRTVTPLVAGELQLRIVLRALNVLEAAGIGVVRRGQARELHHLLVDRHLEQERLGLLKVLRVRQIQIVDGRIAAGGATRLVGHGRDVGVGAERRLRHLQRVDGTQPLPNSSEER